MLSTTVKATACDLTAMSPASVTSRDLVRRNLFRILQVLIASEGRENEIQESEALCMQRKGRCSFWQLRRYGSEYFLVHSLSSYITHLALSRERQYRSCNSCVQQARQGTLL